MPPARRRVPRNGPGRVLPHLPASFGTGEAELDQRGLGRDRQLRERGVAGAHADQRLGRRLQQFRRELVDETDVVARVEDDDRDVGLTHDFFEDAEQLLLALPPDLQAFDQAVDLWIELGELAGDRPSSNPPRF